MLQIWTYQDAMGVQRFGAMVGFSDFGGTDVPYRFHRLGDDGHVIEYPNGGHMLDVVSGGRLKAARRVGAIAPGEAFASVTIEIRGVNGAGKWMVPAATWDTLSPCAKVLAIHDARRDLTRGKPFDVLSASRNPRRQGDAAIGKDAART